jgi:hypothetical protein
MRSQYLVCVMLAGLAYGQAAPPAKPPSAGNNTQSPSSAPGPPAKAPEVKVGPDDTVITVKGYCTDTSLQGDACKTLITRAQFDKLADALQPNMPPAVRRNLADAYATMLKMSAAAEKRGIDKGPKFDELVAFARLQILRKELQLTLQEESTKVTDADIEAYYKANETSYEQATFARIFVPRAKQIPNPAATPQPGAKAEAKPVANAAPTEAQQKAAEEAMTKLADSIHASAVAGEDPDALQKKAYTEAGLPGNAPPTKMDKVRRTMVPANHQAVFALKVGEVSNVITDPSGGHYIYKVISKETMPLDSVKTEIRNTISGQRYRDSMQAFQGEAELNDAYFGPARGPVMPPRPKGPPTSDQPAADR